MSEVLKSLFSNDKADEIVSAINSIRFNNVNEYAKSVGISLLNTLENVAWTNSYGSANLTALREAVYATPDSSQLLPYGYSRCDYIEKYTGMATIMDKLINIKEYPNIYEKGIDITFGYNSEATGTSLAILGARFRSSSVADNSQSFAFYTNKTGLFMHLYGQELARIVQSGVTQGPNSIKFRPQSGGAVVTVNGESATITGSYSTTLSLPGLGISGNPCYYTDGSQSDNPSITGGVKVGNIKIYDGDVVIGNYVPCLRTIDNVLGFYDTVDKAFYTTRRLAYATPGNSACIYRAGEW